MRQLLLIRDFLVWLLPITKVIQPITEQVKILPIITEQPKFPAYGKVIVDFDNQKDLIRSIQLLSNGPVTLALIGCIISKTGYKQNFTATSYKVITKMSDVELVAKMQIENAEYYQDQYSSEGLNYISIIYELKYSQLTNIPIKLSSGRRSISTQKDYHYSINQKYTYVSKSQYIPNSISIAKWRGWVEVEQDVWVGKVKGVEWKCSINGNTKVFTLDADIDSITIIDEDMPIGFSRKFLSKKQIIESGIIVTSEYIKPGRMLTPLKSVMSFDESRISSLDIECQNIKGSFVPYVIGYYDYLGFKYFYGLECVKDMLEYLVGKEINVYVHNQDRFDKAFILKQAIQLGYNLEIIPGVGGNKSSVTGFIIKNPTIKKITKLVFMDSYKLLPLSLAKQPKAFGLPISKLDFPYSFMDSESKMNYIGEKPLFTDFDSITLDDYNMQPTVWDAKKETQIYLERDCKVLYDVVQAFGKELNNTYGIDFLKKYTLPSLAMSVFRTNFYKLNIANLSDSVDFDIRKSFYGGVVDVYKPEMSNGYYYDVNSLFPYAMTKDMPLGTPTYVKGKIDLNTFFGFLYVKIKAPNLKIPFLPYKTDKGQIVPIGEWTGWYFSEELKYAVTQGYTIEVLDVGYSFERGLPFNDYVNNFYMLKRNAENASDKFIAKLFLNSLYGKFGMKNLSNTIEILTAHQLEQYLLKDYLVEDIIYFDEMGMDKGLFLVKRMEDKKSSFSNVAIASAITAYSRINIDGYKRLPNNECFYTDTDSVFIQNPQPDSLINLELGGMKLEDKVKYGIFVSPKVYGYITKDHIIVKAKGVSSNLLSISDLNKLLYFEDITISQTIFRRTIDSVKLLTLSKTLSNTITNKRVPIIIDGKLVDTKSIKMSGGG